MPNSVDVDKPPPIVDRINDAILPDPNPPQVFGPFELPAPGGPWIARQRFDPTEYPHSKRLVEPLKLLACAAGT